MTIYIKELLEDGLSPYQSFPWPLPRKRGHGWQPGAWVEIDQTIAQEYREDVEVRMGIWRKGYGLLCDVDGVLYVYEGVE